MNPNQFEDGFPLVISKTVTDKKRRGIIDDRMNSTSAVTIADPMMMREGREHVAEENLGYLKQIGAELASRDMKVGGVIGAGSIGIIYELLDKQGKIIENSVLRIDPREAICKFDDAYRASEPLAALPILFQAEAGQPLTGDPVKDKDIAEKGYRATIVPRVDDRLLTPEAVEKSLSVYNAQGKLGRLKDLKMDQFMAGKGVDIPLLGDMGSLKPQPDEEHREKDDRKGKIGVIQFAKKEGLNANRIIKDKASGEEMDTLRTQKKALEKAALDELRADGVNVEMAPSRQSVTSVEPGVERRKERGRETQA